MERTDQSLMGGIRIFTRHKIMLAASVHPVSCGRYSLEIPLEVVIGDESYVAADHNGGESLSGETHNRGLW